MPDNKPLDGNTLKRFLTVFHAVFVETDAVIAKDDLEMLKEMAAQVLQELNLQQACREAIKRRKNYKMPILVLSKEGKSPDDLGGFLKELLKEAASTEEKTVSTEEKVKKLLIYKQKEDAKCGRSIFVARRMLQPELFQSEPHPEGESTEVFQRSPAVKVK